MLNINPETVCFLIAKAREFHAKEEVVIPEVPTSPAEDWARQVLADHVDDACLAEFAATIDDLEPDQQHEVVALMWVGRDDFGPTEWLGAVAEAAEQATPETARYLIAHPLLADYLEEGLAALGYRCEE
ncbi:MAG TPA: DUF3775 domain-containing protein [Thioalkalivibrio sp.]|nr:DUF3775 domain-containing protein [Thioalkalivibrio sp.]